jgi:hypothetical protein
VSDCQHVKKRVSEDKFREEFLCLTCSQIFRCENTKSSISVSVRVSGNNSFLCIYVKSGIIYARGFNLSC